LYGTPGVENALKRIYHYAFAENRYPGAPVISFNPINGNPFDFEGMKVIPIKVKHAGMPVLGFRFGDLAYITDAKQIEDEELEKVKECKVVVLNALRKTEHHSHLNLEQALRLMEIIKPQQGYFTHISHLLGKHHEVEKELPSNIHLAYDGLVVEG
ncbi:MAG: MBL fold metallo-hydrolase, partial [Flavobacteriales bacterium]|nr:MBL fold metallo-hydrolase [Flavobacteriales bacterium]